MRAHTCLILCVAVVLTAAFAFAAADKEVTLNGKVTCTKCDLNKSKECETVIVVSEEGKDVIYYLDQKAGKANHEAICQGGKQGTVTGKVSEKGGKKVITASKVELQQ